MRISDSLILWLLLSIPLQSQHIEWVLENERYTVQRVRMPDDEVEIDSVEASAKKTIAQIPEKDFISLQFFASSTDRCFLDTKGFHLGYPGWAYLFRACRMTLPQLAEVIKWRGGTILRHRIGDTITNRILDGTDPLLFQSSEMSLRLAYIAFPGPAFGRKDDDTVDVFAVAEALPRRDMRPYREAYALLVRSLPFKRTTLYIRSDEWFILESTFPVQGPFNSTSKPPSEEAFDRTGIVYCSPYKTEDVCVAVGLEQAAPK